MPMGSPIPTGSSRKRERARGLSVRLLLVAFAVVLLGPVLALAAVALSQYATSERTRYVNEGREAVRRIAADLDRELGRVEAAAQALVTSPLIASGNYEAFQRQASDFLRSWAPDEPDAYAVILRDLNGQQLVNTRLPWGTPLPKVERDIDKLVITTKRPQVQDLFFSASANHFMIAVRVPVLKDGEVTHVLSLALEPTRIAELLRDQPLPAGWNRSVFDRSERAVARWPEHERFVGTPASENLRRNAIGDEGVLVSINFNGVPILAAYAHSKISGWRVLAGVPLSVLQEPYRRWWWTIAALCTVALVLLIGLAFWFGRQLAGPIHALTASADQLARGQSVSPLRTGLHEIDEVSYALALASNRLAASTRERLRVAGHLHSTLAHSLLALLTQLRLARKLVRHDPAAVETELTHAEEAVQEGLAQARATVEELQGQALGEEGFGPALERLAARLRAKTSLEIRLHVDPAAAGLVEEKAEGLYRIAEEALRNVECHSGAERVDVNVRVDHPDGAERLTLAVADDGAGFDPGAAPSDHYGLLGMREHAELIGAELHVDSAPGQGTRVSVSIPA